MFYFTWIKYYYSDTEAVQKCFCSEGEFLFDIALDTHSEGHLVEHTEFILSLQSKAFKIISDSYL